MLPTLCSTSPFPKPVSVTPTSGPRAAKGRQASCQQGRLQGTRGQEGQEGSQISAQACERDPDRLRAPVLTARCYVVRVAAGGPFLGWERGQCRREGVRLLGGGGDSTTASASASFAPLFFAGVTLFSVCETGAQEAHIQTCLNAMGFNKEVLCSHCERKSRASSTSCSGSGPPTLASVSKKVPELAPGRQDPTHLIISPDGDSPLS